MAPHVRPGLGHASPPQHVRQRPVSEPRGVALRHVAVFVLCSEQPRAAPLDEQPRHVDVSAGGGSMEGRYAVLVCKEKQPSVCLPQSAAAQLLHDQSKQPGAVLWSRNRQ